MTSISCSLPRRFVPGLKTLNWIALVVHVVLTIAFFVLVFVYDAAGKCVPVTQTRHLNRPGFVPGVNSTVAFGTTCEPMGSLCFGFLGLAVEILTAFSHAYVLCFYAEYETYLRLGVNPLRWAEYAVTSTLMLLLIETVAAVTDYTALLNSAAANVAMIACGYWNETNKRRLRGDYEDLVDYETRYDVLLRELRYLRNPKSRDSEPSEKTALKLRKTRKIEPSTSKASFEVGDEDPEKNPAIPRDTWIPFSVGCVVGVVPWIGIYTAYGITMAKSSQYVPWFVHVFVAELFFFFFSFAVVEFLWTAGWIQKFENKEWYYVFLSLTSKASLAFTLASTFVS